jgi:hypothetical protein
MFPVCTDWLKTSIASESTWSFDIDPEDELWPFVDDDCPAVLFCSDPEFVSDGVCPDWLDDGVAPVCWLEVLPWGDDALEDELEGELDEELEGELDDDEDGEDELEDELDDELEDELDELDDEELLEDCVGGVTHPDIIMIRTVRTAKTDIRKVFFILFISSPEVIEIYTTF